MDSMVYWGKASRTSSFEASVVRNSKVRGQTDTSRVELFHITAFNALLRLWCRWHGFVHLKSKGCNGKWKKKKLRRGDEFLYIWISLYIGDGFLYLKQEPSTPLIIHPILVSFWVLFFTVLPERGLYRWLNTSLAFHPWQKTWRLPNRGIVFRSLRSKQNGRCSHLHSSMAVSITRKLGQRDCHQGTLSSGWC